MYKSVLTDFNLQLLKGPNTLQLSLSPIHIKTNSSIRNKNQESQFNLNTSSIKYPIDFSYGGSNKPKNIKIISKFQAYFLERTHHLIALIEEEHIIQAELFEIFPALLATQLFEYSYVLLHRGQGRFLFLCVEKINIDILKKNLNRTLKYFEITGNLNKPHQRSYLSQNKLTQPNATRKN